MKNFYLINIKKFKNIFPFVKFSKLFNDNKLFTNTQIYENVNIKIDQDETENLNLPNKIINSCKWNRDYTYPQDFNIMKYKLKGKIIKK